MNRFSSLLAVAMILCIIPVVAGIENGYSRMVYNVSGLQDYSLHWNDRFPPGSNLSIYVEADGVNHRRAVGVDYIFIIRDSNNNIVDTALYENRFRDYEENGFKVYNRAINESWEDGYYTAQIHIYDLLNDSIMEKYYDDVATTLVDETNESDILPDIPYMNRGYIRNHSELDATQHRVIIQKFWIDRYADKYPVNRFIVDGMIIERERVAQNENVNIFVNIKNNFYDSGNVSLDVIMDGQKIGNTTVDIDAFESNQTIFNISSDIIGNHTVEIIPVSKNTMGLDLLRSFEVSEQEVTTPVTFIYKDMTIDNLSVEPNQTVTITVTIENRGMHGSLPINLLINDVPDVESKQIVFLNFSEQKDVKFNITKEELGEYKISINNSDLSKIFFVTSKDKIVQKKEEEIEKKVEGISKSHMIAGLLILVILILIAKRYIKNKY